MEEEVDTHELQHQLEELEGFQAGWSRWLAVTTALIAVGAAIASLESGDLANRALLAKNDAVLFQGRATNQWGYYQAKRIKMHFLEAVPSAAGDLHRYQVEQAEIRQRAEELDRQTEAANQVSERFLERHHRAALAVTTFQIAIALAAMSALLRRKPLWIFSLAMAAGGLAFLSSAAWA